MVEIIKEKTFGSEFGRNLGAGLGKGFSEGVEVAAESKKKLADLRRENEEIYKATGIKLQGVTPEIRKAEFAHQLKLREKDQEFSNEVQRNQPILNKMEKDRGLEPGSLSVFAHDPKLAEQYSRPPKEKAPLGGLSGVPPTPEESAEIERVIRENPDVSAEELELKFNKSGKIAPARTKEILESRRRAEEKKENKHEKLNERLYEETLPLRQQILKNAQTAQQSIQNKQHLLDLIDKGNIDDPTYAAVVESLPLNLGKRLLSPDTVEYKSGLIDEFGDLRTIFSGTTRVKEIELLEQKVADLYLTDQQKKTILKSRINANKAAIIFGEVAAEIDAENKPLGLFQYQDELNKRAKPRIDALFNQVLDEQKSIIENAERRKSLPLNPDDPEDLNILQQILKEAKGDKVKARKIAAEKGYKF